MATSSSAKKASQLAARSSASSNKKSSWMFPVVIVLIVALGIGVVAFARSQNEGVGDNDTPPRAQLAQGSAFDHWHAAYSINVCGQEIGPVVDAKVDTLGIHTHSGQSLIHIHPHRLQSSGDNARIQLFFDQVGIEITDTGFKMPDGQVYSEEETTCGGEPTELTLSVWDKPLEATVPDPDEVYTEDFGSVRFTADQQAYTLALLPVGETADLPASVGDLVNPNDVEPEGIPGDPGVPDIPVDGSGEIIDVPAEGDAPADEAPTDGTTADDPAATTEETEAEAAPDTTAAGSAG